jgi:hypothetical protein
MASSVSSSLIQSDLDATSSLYAVVVILMYHQTNIQPTASRISIHTIELTVLQISTKNTAKTTASRFLPKICISAVYKKNYSPCLVDATVTEALTLDQGAHVECRLVRYDAGRHFTAATAFACLKSVVVADSSWKSSGMYSS